MDKQKNMKTTDRKRVYIKSKKSGFFWTETVIVGNEVYEDGIAYILNHDDVVMEEIPIQRGDQLRVYIGDYITVNKIIIAK